MREARRPTQSVTLLLSVALAATLGVLIYFSVTSLPYLAVSPTSDPTFGEINGCLLQAVPAGRVGYAVAPDAKAAAVWSNSVITRCLGPNARTWSISGITEAAFDGKGRLWATTNTADAGGANMLLLDGDAPEVRGEARPAHIVGVEDGVVVLESSGRLLSLKADGSVGGLVDLRPMPDAVLSVSGDGRRVAITTGGGLFVFESSKLLKVRAEAPCDVEFLWWLREGHHVLISCGPRSSWAIALEADTGEQDAAPPRGRIHSVLCGAQGPWVQSCDVLPCTAVEP